MYGVETVFTQSISRKPGYLYFSIRKITSRSGFCILNQIQLKQTHLQNLTLFINLLLVFFFRISVCLWISFDMSRNARPWSSWRVLLPLNRVIHHCGRTDTSTMADKHSRRMFRHNKVYYFSCYNTAIPLDMAFIFYWHNFIFYLNVWCYVKNIYIIIYVRGPGGVRADVWPDVMGKGYNGPP